MNVDQGVYDQHANGAANSGPTRPHPARPLSPSDIIRAWREAGQIVRIPTGFPTLDEACRGGLPIPWRVSIVGAPSAGKTALAMVLASRFEAAGLCCGVLGIDEDPDDLAARFVQMSAFTIAQCEQRDTKVLDAMATRMASLRIRFYDASHTIETAADDLGTWAATEKRKAAFFIDTVQTAACETSLGAKNPRERVEANAAALRAAGQKHKLLLITLSEANRGSYRSEDAADQTNDMAAGAESRAIEFSAQTLLMLRTPKGYADVVHLRVPKNRKGARAGFEFWLKLDRDRHALTECDDPETTPGVAEERASKTRATNRAAVERDARAVLRLITITPGMGTRALRTALRVAGTRIGVESLDAAIALLLDTGRIENRETHAGSRVDAHYYACSTGGVP